MDRLIKWRAERSILPSVSPAREPSGNDAYGAGETRRNEGVRLTNKNGDIYIEVLNIDIIRYDLR